jgi:hypothetical protein
MWAEGSPPATEYSALLKVAVLPFENRTPNPNVDWISALFVDSYKTALAGRFRYADAEAEKTTRALELIAEYKITGKVRYQVFSAMTGADVVLGGTFSPSGGESIVIESQLYYAKNNSFEVLVRQQASIDSSQLFPAVDKSAAASVDHMAKGDTAAGEKPALYIPHTPRLLMYGVSSRARLGEKLRAILGDPETRDFYFKTLASPVPEGADEEKAMAALMKDDHAAYAILARGTRKETSFAAELRVYSPLKPAALATFTGEGDSEEAALFNAAQQVAGFIRGWKFKPQINVEGLKGKDLTLEYAGRKKSTTSVNGVLEFNDELPPGAAYEFTLAEEPVKPTQRCFVVNGSGKTTITGVNHATTVCITRRYAVEGVVEGLGGGEIVAKLGDTDAVTLRENAPFRFPDTLEDFEILRLAVIDRPKTPPQQCDFVSPPGRVSGKTVSLRLYCMPLTQHWLTVSGVYPIMQDNTAHPDRLKPNASFPLNSVSGRWGLTLGYWAKYYLRYNILVGGEATYAYLQGNADLYTASGIFVEPGHALYYHGAGINGMVGYPFSLPVKWLEKTRLVAFLGAGADHAAQYLWPGCRCGD